MTAPTMIIASIGGLLLLCALPLAGISLWRYSAITRIREWRWALLALALSASIQLGQGLTAVALSYFPEHWNMFAALIGWLANFSTLAHSALFLAVARALVLMARRQENG